MCRNALEDPWEEAREDMYTRSVSPEQAPDKATYIDLEFEGGNPVAIDGQQLSPASLLTQLNKVKKKRHEKKRKEKKRKEKKRKEKKRKEKEKD